MITNESIIAHDTVVGAVNAPSLTDSSIIDGETADTCLSTIQTEAVTTITSQHSIESNSEGVPLILCISALVVALGTAYCLYRIHRKLTSTLRRVIEALKKLKHENESLVEENLNLNTTIEELKHSYADLNNRISKFYVSTSHNIPTSSTESGRPDNGVSSPIISEPQSNVEIMFGNLQAPNQNGVLRFASRGLTNEPSATKMFILDVDNLSGHGTYTINPKAMALITGDLQLFSYFVKPFNFSGTPDTAHIKTVHPGKIVKSGQFWIVEDLLEVEVV